MLYVLAGVTLVPMASLQLDGRFSNSTYIRYLGELSADGSGDDGVAQFTVCLRMRLNYLRGQSNYIVSYAFNGTDNGLTIGNDRLDIVIPVDRLRIVAFTSFHFCLQASLLCCCS